MTMSGVTWIDATPAGEEVRALIGGQECGRGRVFHFNSEPPEVVGTYSLVIASDAMKSGCGVRGSQVIVFIDDQRVNRDFTWAPGDNQVPLVVGPDFARYYGHLVLDAGLAPAMRVVPYLNGIACGTQFMGGELYTPFDWWYELTVYPDALQPGCGYDGAEISFMLEIDGQSSVDLGTELWDTRQPVTRGTIDVTGKIVMRPAP
jgi:hypothetical protein